MKSPNKIILQLSSFMVLLGLPAWAAAGHIDLFETAHSAEANVMAPPPQGVGSVANPAPSALGGERDLFVNKTAGADGERLRARLNALGATKLRIDSDAGVKGSVFLTWDGEDANPNPFTGVDYDGLGGIDLTDGGTWDGFDLNVSFSDIGGPVRLIIYDHAENNAASAAIATFAVPAGIASDSLTTLHLDFNDFTGVTSALTNAGAIVMEVLDDRGGWDLNIVSLVRSQAVPEPSCLLLLCLAPLGALRFRRCRPRIDATR